MKNLMPFLDYIPQLTVLILRAMFRSKWMLFALVIGLAYYFVISDVIDIFTEIQTKMDARYIIK
jgi:hypothetical protein